MASLKNKTRKTTKTKELQLFKDLFNLSRDAIFIEDLNGYVLEVNPAACKLHNCPKEYLIGKHIKELIAPECWEQAWEDFQALVQHKTYKIEGVSLTEDGRKIPVEITASHFNYKDTPSLLMQVRDISDRKKKEVDLFNQLKVLSAVTSNLPVLLYKLSRKGEIIESYGNLSNLINNNSPPKELTIEKFLSNFSIKENLKHVFKGQTIDTLEQVDTGDNGILWFRNYLMPFNTEIVLGLSINVTDFKLATAEVEKNKQFLDHLIEAIPGVIFGLFDEQLRYHVVRGETCHFPWPLDEMIGKTPDEVYPPDVAKRLSSHYKAAILGTKNTLEIQIGPKYYKVYVTPFRVQDKPENFGLAICRDITEEKKEEARIMRIFLEAQDIERKRISEELHDSIGQVLTSVKLNLMAMDCPEIQSSQQLKKLYDNTNDLLKSAMTEIRKLSHELMPNSLGDYGLTLAIDNLLNKIKSSGKIKTNFQIHGNECKLPEELEIGLFRIIQEAVSNVLKHARASQLHVQLFYYPDSLLVSVEDDGIGFNPDKPLKNNSLGLHNIRTRAKAIGAELSIDSAPGKGTNIIIEIDLNK